jgi:hypothetical protein
VNAAQFTPGPWKAHIQRSKQGDDLGWIVEFNNGRIGWASLAYADINREAEKDDPAREANAHLMAAAPRMYAALEGCILALDPCPQRSEAKAALAKARGDQ